MRIISRGIVVAALVAFSNITHSAIPPALSNPDTTLETHLGDPFLGELRGSATVSAAGNAAYALPIELPQGTAGMTPQLTLGYNSNLQNSLLGLGWFLGGAGSTISRCPQTLAQDGRIRAVKNDTDDRFCLDGQRLVAVNGEYGDAGTEYRTEIDTLRRITSHGVAAGSNSGPEYFTVDSSDGRTSHYGASDDSRIEAQGMSQVATWALNRVTDAFDNYYSIEYAESNNQGSYRPKNLFYTGNESQGLDPYVRVAFHYEDRPDQPFFFRGGAKVKEYKKRMERISIEVDNTLVAEYRLSYQEFGVNASSSPSGNQSRLSSIERCNGKDDCQEPLSLEWWADQQGTPLSYYELFVPSDTQQQHQKWLYPRWHDLNGDGTPDYVYTVQSGSSQEDQKVSGIFEVMLSGPGGWSTSTWETPEITPHRNFSSITWADINGDGRTDMITPRLAGSDRWEFGIAFSTGTDFDVQYWDGYSLEGYGRNHYFYDMNGDGLLDLVIRQWDRDYLNYRDCNDDIAYSYAYSYSIKVGLNNGSEFEEAVTWIDEIDKNADLADMDGDGLIDLVAETRFVHFNNGEGFSAAAEDFKSYGANDCNNPFSYSALFFDFNADGLADRYKAGAVQYNNGRSFESARAPQMFPLADLNGDGKRDSFWRTTYGVLNNPKIARVALMYMRDNFGGHSKNRNLDDDDRLTHFQQLADVNGDGIEDYTANVTWYCLPHSNAQLRQWCETDRIRVYQSDNPPARLLRTITSGLGHKAEFSYSFLTDSDIYTKYDDAITPIIDIQDSTPVVSSIRQSDGIGGQITMTYSYEGLKRDRNGRGLLGFAKMTEENATFDTRTTTHFSQEFPYSSQPILVEAHQISSDTLLSSTRSQYQAHNTSVAGSVLPYQKSSTNKVYDSLDGRLLATTHEDNTVDSYGNVLMRTVEVNDHIEQSIQQTKIVSTYNIDESNWRIGQLETTSMSFSQDGVTDASLERNTAFDYAPSSGMLVESIQEPGKGAGLEFTKALQYGFFGNPKSESLSGPALQSRTSTTIFDGRGRFPTAQLNPQQHRVQQTWDEFHGGLLTQTDANGLVTHWRYDNFGRQTEEHRPDGTSTSNSWHIDESGSVARSHIYKQTIVTGAPAKREFLDSIGRLVSARTQSFDGSYLNIDAEYDHMGRKIRTSMPYLDGDIAQWNTTDYDALDRITLYSAVDLADGYQRSYAANTVTHIDSRSRQSKLHVNALGQTIATQDPGGMMTRFIYDAAGNRTRVAVNADGASSNAVQYSYDRLGRLLSMNDPDHGLYTYSYDALGQKISERSPQMTTSGASITYQYDLLGRLISRDEPEGQATWTFDETSHDSLAIGKLTRESFGAFSRDYVYSPAQFGRLTSVRSQIDRFGYDRSYSYNENGKTATVTYPSGFVVENVYNPLGYLERLQAPGGGEVYYQLLTVNSLGHTTQEWKGDGSYKNISYDGASLRIQEMKTVIGDNIVQNFAYNYDNIGSMTSRNDSRSGLGETFSYDVMDRLESAQVAGGTTVNYDFDANGNITRKSDTADLFEYTGSAPHAITQVHRDGQVAQLSYNSNGNYVAGDNRPAITWASYNKPLRLVQGAIRYDYEYGPDRKRFKRRNGKQKKHYVGHDYEKIFFGYLWGEQHYVKVNGRPVMLRQTFLGAAVNSFVHTDHLGSITALTSDSGEVTQRFSYDAWGKRRDANDWSTAVATNIGIRGYTGHEHMDDLGLINMNGRVYSPGLGRMLSPDPVTEAPENGQNYNRYSYVFNNPLKYTDPSGLSCFRATAGYDALGIFHSSVVCTIAPLGPVNLNFRSIVTRPTRNPIINRSRAATYIRAMRLIRRRVLSRVGDFTDSVGNPYNTVLPTGLLTNNSLYQQFFDYGGNLTAIEQGLVDEIQNGRQPDKIYITGHRIAELGPVHTAIEFTDPSGQQVTLSAGPGAGALVSDINRPLDAPSANFTIGYVSLPDGVSAAQYANSLLAADAAYCDCVDYAIFPGMQKGFNSNSYVAGLIRSTGGSTSGFGEGYIGARRPLPKRFFRQKR